VAVFSQDFVVYDGSLGEAFAEKLQRQFVAVLAAKSGFKMELGEERATNSVYGILRDAVYLPFCVERDWRVEDGTA
jgi:hypothetical protein